MADSEEGRLLARAQRGDMVAFESLVHMHQQRVYAYCYRLIGNNAEAEDLCAETFLRAFQHLRALRADPSIVHWLLHVANNLAISQLRKRGTRPTVQLDEAHEYPSARPSPEEEAMARSRQDVVRACLMRMAPTDRAAVLMFYLEDRSLNEVAAVLGCGLAAAKSRIHRARLHLKAMVQAELGTTVDLPIIGEGGSL